MRIQFKYKNGEIGEIEADIDRNIADIRDVAHVYYDMSFEDYMSCKLQEIADECVLCKDSEIYTSRATELFDEYFPKKDGVI